MKQIRQTHARATFLAALKQSPLGKRLDLATLELLSERAEACPLQDPFRVRARYLGWKSASILIDEKGEIDRSVLEGLLKELEEAPFPLGHESDTWLYMHLFTSLQALANDEGLARLLKKCSLPLCNKTAEAIVRETLWPEEVGPLKTAHLRRAVLTAWLTLLRQATGSCFATAPAMLIQKNSPGYLLQDMDQLLSGGEIRRGGFVVPMNPGGGAGELHKQLGDLAAPYSPGLQAAFHAVGIPLQRIPARGTSAQAIIDNALLDHFGLTADDLAQEKTSQAAHLGVMWEKTGGHYSGPTERAKKIQDWEKARARARHAFLAMADCALLRCWEYTIASYCDVKVEFARWNLYVSLGLDPEAKPSGIARFLYERVQGLLDRTNQEIVKMHAEHQQAVGVVRSAESQLRSASESRRNQIQAELVGAVHTVNHLAEQLSEASQKAEWLSKIYAELLQQIIERLQDYFQEVFDPSLIPTDTEELFEDSPAGFRLICKHGRSSSASWERIESQQQFCDALFRFFESLEREMQIPETRRELFSALMTQLLQHVRSEEFLLGSVQRAKKSRSPHRGSPWAYESGGTMQTLLQHYLDLSSLPEQFSRKIQTEKELMEFLNDLLPRLQGPGPFLMVSPTHGFLFYPTWMRDGHTLERNSRFLKTLSVSEEQIDFLRERFAEHLPEAKRPLFYFGCRQAPVSDTITSLRQSLLQGIQTFKEIKEESVDGFLYESLPLFTPEEAKSAKKLLFASLSARFRLKEIPEIEMNAPFLTPRDLVQNMKAILVSMGVGVFSSVDWEGEIVSELRKELFIYPFPLLFGDTNWSDWCFGFVQQFASGECELWRLSRTAQRGLPMRDWKPIFREGGIWSILP